MSSKSSIEQQSSRIMKNNRTQDSLEGEKTRSFESRSLSPPPPPMPPKPSPSTIHRALAFETALQKPKDKVKNAVLPPPPSTKMPPRSQQRFQSQTADTTLPRKSSTTAKLSLHRSKSKNKERAPKETLPPLPSSFPPTTKPPLPIPTEDAFAKLFSAEDSDIDEDLDSDELLDPNTDSSDQYITFSEDETDSSNSLIKQVQKVHMDYTKKEHAKSKDILEMRNSAQSNKDGKLPSLETPKKPPPPLPPSEKYHVKEDGEIKSTIAAPTLASPLIKPPSAIDIPLSVLEEEKIKKSVKVVPTNSPPLVMPQLPPRPSRSTLARAHTIASSPRRRPESTSPRLKPTSNSENNEKPVTTSVVRVTSNITKHTALSRIDLMTSSIYPDFSQATRNPPLNILEKTFVTGHKGALTGVVASRNRLVTSSGTLRTWNIKENKLVNVLTIDTNSVHENTTQTSPESNTSRIQVVVIAPTKDPKEEGRYIWVARQELCVLDLQSPTNNNQLISRRADVHKSPITFLLRNGNSEIWSIDQEGVLNIWDVLSLEPVNPLFKAKPRQYKVTPQAVAATIYDSQLWVTSGRELIVHHIPPAKEPPTKSQDIPLSFSSARVPNDMGSISKLVTIPYHPRRLFASHKDGKISVWDTKTLERLQVITVSMYGISTMASVGEFHLWAGYSTGMIYVYDTRPDKWVVLKMWKAHSAAVTQLYVDETGLLLDEHRGRLQVVSGDSYGYVGVWDGLLTEHWKDSYLQAKESEFCSYNNTRVMLCSWNIDAVKPDKMTVEDKKCAQEWLGSMEDPDIIVVGIQEIVDLVSKKQTARSLFFNKKTNISETEELRMNHYRLWLDFLVQTITASYGKDTFTVAKTDELVGLFSCVFVRTSNFDRIFDIDSTSVKTGLKVMNKSLHGNKGGIAIRLVYNHSSLCFINCHLAAGQSHTQQRNADAEGILQGATFPRRNYADVFYHGGDGAMIFDHEFCFLSGDLNYRINMSRNDVLKLLTDTDKKNVWKKLQEQDQLLRQKINNPLFKLLTFKEAPIQFDPTYKYEPGTDFYDRSEKRRIPAWCDRVLFKGKHIENLFYRRFEARCSDHRPIAAGFSIETKLSEQKKRDVVTAKLNEEWREYIDQFVKNRKAVYVSQYGKCTVDEAFKLLERKDWDVSSTVLNLIGTSDNK